MKCGRVIFNIVKYFLVQTRFRILLKLNENTVVSLFKSCPRLNSDLNDAGC
jgi:hypothetical protein